MERLQKVMARAGVGSRRTCEQFIRAGDVAVDGVVVTHLGAKVDPKTARITVRGKPLAPPSSLVHLMLNKPRGYVSTVRDTHGRPTVLHLVPDGVRLFPVGRLDADSEGLMFLTNDGPWSHRITHPRFEIEKEYEVLVSGKPDRARLQALRDGVLLEEGMTSPARVDVAGAEKGRTLLRFVIHEGRKRQLRRMLAAVGYEVERLVRVRIGPVRLGGLPAGAYRPLTVPEVHSLGLAGGPDWPATVAVDGPAGVGKSTVGQLLAQELGYLYFDTGVMYRALTLAALRKGISPHDEESLRRLAERSRIVVTEPTVDDGRQYTVLLDGEDVTWDIRTPEVDAAVSEVSRWPAVRQALIGQQREIASGGRVVMVGRDVGTVVLPDADLKIYLDATVETRAWRRYRELVARGEQPSFANVLRQIEHRDLVDSQREASPLMAAPDAISVDTENKTVEEVLQEIRGLIEKRAASENTEE